VALVEITMMGSFWCDCGNMFGRAGWPMPQIVIDEAGVCPLCKVIHHGPVIQMFVNPKRLHGRR